MSTITREFTKKQLTKKAAEQIKLVNTLELSHDAAEHAAMCAALFEIALEKLDGESAGWQVKTHGGNWKSINDNDVDHYRFNEELPVREVYTAPPAPVAPDLKELEAILDWILMLPCPTPKATHFAKRLAVVIDTCRNAMLQGAENAETPTTMQTAPAMDSSPKVAESPSGNYPVIPDGWVMVPVEPTPDMREAYHQAQAEYEDSDGLWSPDHQWQAMLAAAPQQEVKP